MWIYIYIYIHTIWYEGWYLPSVQLSLWSVIFYVHIRTYLDGKFHSIYCSKNESDRLANRDLKTPSKITQTHYTSLLRSSHPNGGLYVRNWGDTNKRGAPWHSQTNHGICSSRDWGVTPQFDNTEWGFCWCSMTACLYSCNFWKYSIGIFQQNKIDARNKWFSICFLRVLYIDFHKGATPPLPPLPLLLIPPPFPPNTISPAPDAVGHAWTWTPYRQLRMLWGTPGPEHHIASFGTHARENECQSICQIEWENRCQTECQNRCQIECHKECQNICQKACQNICLIECQIECQSICQKTCQIECQKYISLYMPFILRQNDRYFDRMVCQGGDHSKNIFTVSCVSSLEAPVK